MRHRIFFSCHQPTGYARGNEVSKLLVPFLPEPHEQHSKSVSPSSRCPPGKVRPGQSVFTRFSTSILLLLSTTMHILVLIIL